MLLAGELTNGNLIAMSSVRQLRSLGRITSVSKLTPPLCDTIFALNCHMGSDFEFIHFPCRGHRSEVIGTTLMKFSDGFTRLWPSVATIVCYCTAFYLLSQTLSTIPTGIAYAIWSGAGIVLISLLGWLVSGQKLDFPAIAGMLLICAGVLVINIFSKSSPH